MKYYAYIPDKDGNEPLEEEAKVMFFSESDYEAKHFAKGYFHNVENIKLIKFRDFYDEKTHTHIL